MRVLSITSALHRRGATLATVLFFLMLAALLTTLIASRFMVRLRYSRQVECQSQAQLLADSGLATAIAEFRKDPTFGTHNEILNTTLPLPDDPQGTVLLECSGHYRGYTARKRCWLAAPPYPYALASSGPIRSSGGLLMGAVPSGFDPSQGLDVSKLERAEMMTHSGEQKKRPRPAKVERGRMPALKILQDTGISS